MIYFQVWLIQALAAACSGCWHPFKETRHARHACTDIDNRWRSVAATPCVRALTWTYTTSQSQPKVRYLRKFDRGMLFHVIGIQHPAVQWLSTKSPSREGFFFWCKWMRTWWCLGNLARLQPSPISRYPWVVFCLLNHFDALSLAFFQKTVDVASPRSLCNCRRKGTGKTVQCSSPSLSLSVSPFVWFKACISCSTATVQWPEKRRGNIEKCKGTQQMHKKDRTPGIHRFARDSGRMNSNCSRHRGVL